MNRVRSHLQEVDLIGKLADLKESHYKNTLLLTSLIELLTEKHVITKQDFQRKIAEIESDCLSTPTERPIP